MLIDLIVKKKGETGINRINAAKEYQDLQRINNRYQEMKLEKIWGKDEITVNEMNDKVNIHCQNLTEVSREYFRSQNDPSTRREGKIGQKVMVKNEEGLETEGVITGKTDDCTCLAVRY
ncbi:MAG: hypothetical protein H0T62_08225 [Parachlamydiaceae bacterium]|nr:hypothetical protein [Parachlamydiaceae bacterium]